MTRIPCGANFLCVTLLTIALSGCLTTVPFAGSSVTPLPEAANTASNARLRVVSGEGVVRAIPEKN